MTFSAALSDIQLLERLVAFDTTSSKSNLPLVDFLCDYLDRPGVRIAKNRSPDGRKANLLVSVGPEIGDPNERPGLVLSGHMDVVPALEDGWQSDPFTLTEQGDSLVARGSADMKGFLALASNRLRAADGRKLSAPLVLIFTYDEEVGTLGAKHLVDDWEDQRSSWSEWDPLPRAAIIGEPTSLRVVGLHKGHLKARVTLEGRSAHSGYPHLGANAIEAGGRVIDSLAALRRHLEDERPAGAERFPEVPFVALNVGTVQGGSAVNVVPDRCVIEVGARILPGMDSGQLLDRLRRAALDAAGDAPSGAGHRFEVLSDSPPMRVPDEAPITRALRELSGRDEVHSVSYATDAGWLQSLGLDCVIFGPGSIEVAHRPNEFMPRAEMVTARDILEATIGRFCGGAAR
ncbi:MAG: acetylornithine deacetylase [Acidobacteriota bacterium]